MKNKMCAKCKSEKCKCKSDSKGGDCAGKKKKKKKHETDHHVIIR